jgi:uracil-DNA glycosylase family 4
MPEANPPIDPSGLTAEAAADILRFWADAGVDLALDEAPHDRFAENQTRDASPPPEPRPIPRPPFARPSIEIARPKVELAFAASPDEAGRSARALAAEAQDLESLRAALENFTGCGLKATATRLVFFDGVSDARVMFVGEAPGEEEDRTGRPFVGRAGRLLDAMLATIDLDRTKIHIANVVPWRPPGNRTPTPQETAICLPFIKRHIELVRPRVLVCLGGSSATTLLGLKEGITRTRGRWCEYPMETGSIRAMPMLHPAYLLRTPNQKRAAWQDLRALSRALREDG